MLPPERRFYKPPLADLQDNPSFQAGEPGRQALRGIPNCGSDFTGQMFCFDGMSLQEAAKVLGLDARPPSVLSWAMIHHYLSYGELPKR